MQILLLVLWNIVGIGKTTLVRKVCSLLQQREGIEVHGFYTEEVRERASGGRGSRIGFDVVTLSGNRAPLARVGRWGMMHLSLSLSLSPFLSLSLSLSLSHFTSLSHIILSWFPLISIFHHTAKVMDPVELLSISQLLSANIVLN